MLKQAIAQLMKGVDLDEQSITEAVGVIMDGKASQIQMASFLTALRMKGETSEEITGAARAMRARMTTISVDARPLLDTCGTGGDGAGTFNISTAVSFVLAAADIPIAKHGNRAVSSRSGSADVLRALGVNIEATPEQMRACIEQIGIGFLFAPTLHPAMKHAAPIRRELGMRTIFNVLGPLTNPAGATHQLLGVFDRGLVKPLAQVLANLGSEKAWVVHGADGLDELTVCDETYVAIWDGTSVTERTVSPEDAGLTRHKPEALGGGGPEENAEIMRAMLSGKHDGALLDAVALNAGAGLLIADRCDDLTTGVNEARALILSGKPAKVLDALIQHSAS